MSPKFRRSGYRGNWLKFLLIAADAAVVAVGTFLSLWLRKLVFIKGVGPIYSALRLFYLPTYLLFFIGLYIADAFNIDTLKNRSEILISVVKGVLISVIVASAIEFTMRIHFFPRGYIFLFALVVLPMYYFERELIISWWRSNYLPENILILGKISDVEPVLERIKRREKQLFSQISVIVSHDIDVEEVKGIPVVSLKEKKLIDIIKELGINRVIVISPMDYRELLNELHSKASSDVKIEVMPGTYEILIGRPDYSLLADVPLIQLTRSDPPEWYSVVKRIMDVVIALILLIITLPVFIVVSIAIELTSRGPIFFRQKRVGKNFKIFTIYKFRTLRQGAEKENKEVVDLNDPRITRVGRILRKYHLDELPQLVNVIKGDMSLVGPRPEKLEFFRNYIDRVPGYVERQKVKPGLTGLAQVWGDHSIDPEFKLKYDLIYIYNQSLLLDFMILLRTIKVVFKGKSV